MSHAAETFVHEGVRIISVPSPLPGLIRRGNEWTAEDHDGLMAVWLGSPLFDAVPKVEIEDGAVAVDPDDRWDDLGGTKHTGCVYVAIGMMTGLVKIGFLDRRAVRHREYITESAEELAFYTMPAHRADERALHKHFAKVRISRSREWFYPHPAVLSYIFAMM